MKAFRIISFLTAALVPLTAANCNEDDDCTCSPANVCVGTDGVAIDTDSCANGGDLRCFCDFPRQGNSCRLLPGDPTSGPSQSPSLVPTIDQASSVPSASPSSKVDLSDAPSATPSIELSEAPSAGPSDELSDEPSPVPSDAPSDAPSPMPSTNPSDEISLAPSVASSDKPSLAPSDAPSNAVTPTQGSSCETPPEVCPMPERECGWGIWNVWTCQCDCAPGFCISSNQECYNGCTTHLDFNPFGGCAPGCDCPWYPDSSGKTNCVSTVNFAGIYSIHRTAEQCCNKHFSYLDTNSCVQASEGTIEIAVEETTARDARPTKYYPDLYGRDNCIFHNGYYDWMMDAHSDSYLFESESDCCSLWYPARTDCPDLSVATTRDVNERPYPVDPYFYPHQSESNCRFGRNYPQWMAQAQYVGDNLYTTPEECCDRWYPNASDCPLGPDDGVQEGKYWESDVFFYPNWKSNWCNVGNDWPEWMGDPTQADSHLFSSALTCCEAWFSNDVVECEVNTIPTPAAELVPEEWYPTLAWPYACVDDGNIPAWMVSPGFAAYYVFESQAACCQAFYCAAASTLFT